MQNALLILSELHPTHFDPHNGFNAAAALKRLGAKRADVSCDPRLSYPATHGHMACPITDFDKTARSFAQAVLGPIIGKSDIIDLTRAIKTIEQPDITTLSNVGTLYALKGSNGIPLDMATRDGRDLGLVLYLAAKGHYQSLIFPTLSMPNREILLSFGKAAIGEHIKGYGDTINLAHLHKALAKLRPPVLAQTEGMRAIGQLRLM